MVRPASPGADPAPAKPRGGGGKVVTQLDAVPVTRQHAVPVDLDSKLAQPGESPAGDKAWQGLQMVGGAQSADLAVRLYSERSPVAAPWLPGNLHKHARKPSLTLFFLASQSVAR